MDYVATDGRDLGTAFAAAMLGPAIASAFAWFVLTISIGPFALFIALVAFVFALVVAALHVALLGIPLYLLVRRVVEPGWRIAGLCGILLGIAPFLLIAAATGDRLADNFSAAVYLGVMGLIGGLSFQWKLYG